MSKKQLQEIVNRQVTMGRLWNAQQAALTQYLHNYDKKREDELSRKLEEILDAVKDTKDSSNDGSRSRGAQHIPTNSTEALPKLSPSRSSRPRGLLRDRYTCYMNSILQALAAVDPYKFEQKSGVSLENEFHCNRSIPHSNHYQRVVHQAPEWKLNLVWEFLNLLTLLRSADPANSESQAIPPYAFQYTLVRLAEKSEYDGTAEQDVGDFFRDLLEYLHEQPDYRDVIINLFRIETSFAVACDKTNEVKHLSEKYWFLPLNPTPSLQTTTVADVRNGVAQAQIRSVVELFDYNAPLYWGDCPYNHEGCTHRRTLRFTKTPEFLMLQFTRHEMTKDKLAKSDSGRPKLAYKVDFDDNDYTLDLSQYVEAHVDEERKFRYKLRTVIYHDGDTFDTGHYFAISRTERNGLDNWWVCDDDLVSEDPITGPYPPGDGENPRHAQAFMALYEKLDLSKSTKEIQKTQEEKTHDQETQEQKIGEQKIQKQEFQKLEQ